MTLARGLAIALSLVLIALMYRLWVSSDGMREVWRLSNAVAVQEEQNAKLAQRNRELDAEVKDLKEGLDAVEERARGELGMTRDGETFFHVVEPQTENADLENSIER